ncbi:MAG: glycoside hydrolase family 31 protein, partial [Oculatellaceae cyanobacterium bins.114]|nr:glycoside hydrolase family 31 protein [Oculatellaceae cyanobacterium bins.114]
MSFLKELSLKWKFFTGSLFYLTYAPYGWVYSRRRDRVERQTKNPFPIETVDQPGKLLSAEATDRGAQFYFEYAELEITFLTPDFVRVNWRPGLLPVPYAIARSEWDAVTTTLEQTEQGWAVSSISTAGVDGLHVSISDEGHVTFVDAHGQVLREELPPQKPGNGWTHQAKLRSEEHIYGLGERIMPLNLRSARELTEKGEVTDQPKTFRMWNYDAAGMFGPGADPLYLSVPVYLGFHQQGKYLVFYENSFDSRFTFDDQVATAAFEGGALRYYFTTGTVSHLVERYTELTGRSPLPPRWALGYHQSKWGYNNEQSLRKTYQDFEANDLPLSAIHLDIDVQVGFRAFTIDPKRFPKLQSFIQELAVHGVQFITILNPGIKYSRKSNLFLEGQVLDAFCKLPNGELASGPVWPGWCVFPDFTNPVVRKWWSRQYQYLLDVGVAGFWHDMNEPAAFILWGDRSLPKVTRHFMEGRGGDHLEAHNVYGMLQSKAAYESLCQYRPYRRPFLISRAGWAGLQRYAWTWTGDIECTWAALRQTMSTVIGLGLSGIPYSGPDIGGFQGNPSAELYLRWFQMSSFLTFCRTHSSNNVEHRSPWTYGEPTLSIIRQFLKLRYRLLPYFYTLSWEATQTGHPPVRPVFWADPDDASLWDLDDAFLLGDALMVCPVSEEGGRSRSVTFPKGQWYNFWDDTLIDGGTTQAIASPLEQMPLFVKAGSLLPMEEGNHLTLHIYPPTQGVSEAVMYTDAGDGYGDHRLDRFRIQHHDHGIELFWQQEG